MPRKSDFEEVPQRVQIIRTMPEQLDVLKRITAISHHADLVMVGAFLQSERKFASKFSKIVFIFQ